MPTATFKPNTTYTYDQLKDWFGGAPVKCTTSTCQAPGQLIKFLTWKTPAGSQYTVSDTTFGATEFKVFSEDRGATYELDPKWRPTENITITKP